MTSPWSLVQRTLTWPVASQQQARRNALVAGTAMARARRERDEVEEFLEALDRRRTAAWSVEAAPAPLGRSARA